MVKLRAIDYEIVQNQNRQGKQTSSMQIKPAIARAGMDRSGSHDKFSLLEQALAG
jgi:hypothetical protein